MAFAPPLEIDRAPLIAARVAAIRTQIGRAKTDTTIERAMARAAADPDLDRPTVEALAKYASERLAALPEWRVSWGFKQIRYVPGAPPRER